MDFQDRFKGRTSVLKKEGITGLVSANEIPIKNSIGLSFLRSNDNSFQMPLQSRNSTEPSYTPHDFSLPTGTNSPKKLTNMKLGYADIHNRSSLPLKQSSVRSSLPLNNEPQFQSGPSALHANKSANYIERKLSVSKLPKEFMNNPPTVKRDVSLEGYGAPRNSQSQLYQASYFNSNPRLSESKKEYLQDISKIEAFHSVQEEKKNLSAIQKKYRDILRAQKSITKLQEARKFSFVSPSRIDDSEAELGRRPSGFTDKRVQKQWDSQSAESSVKPKKSYLSMSKHRGSHAMIFNKILEGKNSRTEDGRTEAEMMKASLIKNMSINFLKGKNKHRSAIESREGERAQLPKGASIFLRDKLTRDAKPPGLPRLKGYTSQEKFMHFD